MPFEAYCDGFGAQELKWIIRIKVELAQLQTALIRANRPFVSYRLPGHTNPVTMFGADSFQEFNTIDEVLHQKNGFVLAPFAEGKPILWLKANNVIRGFYG
jgi:hypothetical protein